MSKISRVTAKIFGSSANTSQIAKFGSLAAALPTTYDGPTALANAGNVQALSNWLTGWFAGVEGANSPAIEDLNAYCFMMAYQMAYGFQAGIPEWDAGTTYFSGSFAQDGFGNVYVSLTDSNINNVITNSTNWRILTINSAQSLNPSCRNIGLFYTSGTLTITGSGGSGSVLSSSNPAIITINSAAQSGKTVSLKLIAPVSIHDHLGGSDLDSLLLGTTTAVAWASDKPFYLYAVNLDDTDANLAFAIGGTPNLELVQSNANYLGFKGTAPVTSDPSNLIFLKSSTPAAYVSAPVALLGGFTMTKSSSNNWTISLLANGNKVKNISSSVLEDAVFTMPVGQNGADSSNYFTGGGTAPSFSAATYHYKVKNCGEVYCSFSFAGTTTNGSGGQAIQMSVPIYTANSTFNEVMTFLSGIYKAASHSPGFGTMVLKTTGGPVSPIPVFDSLGNALVNTDFSNSGDNLKGSFIYNL